MKTRTAVALAALVINSLWLAHVFLVLSFRGEYLVTEPMKWVAGFELIATLALAGLGVERLLKLREDT